MHAIHVVSDVVVYLVCGFFFGREVARIQRASRERKIAAQETAAMAERLRQQRGFPVVRVNVSTERRGK